jgi:hypothetical protein
MIAYGHFYTRARGGVTTHEMPTPTRRGTGHGGSAGGGDLQMICSGLSCYLAVLSNPYKLTFD